jgi:hypothetical protein
VDFGWRDQPTVLITSGERYGAVLKRALDYLPYLDTLASYGFNLTRTFSGVYCERRVSRPVSEPQDRRRRPGGSV